MNTRNHRCILKTVVLTIFLWLTVSVNAFSQGYIFNTQIINVEDGLPHRMVYYLTQDKDGFIWLSTQGAISRYDGYNFKTYTREFLNLPEGTAPRLAIDADNRLWYSSKAHSGVIDIQKDSIYSMESMSGGRFSAKDVVYISNASENSDVVLIMTRSGVIYKYDSRFEAIYRASRPFIHGSGCKAAPGGGYWVMRPEELIKIKDGKALKTIPLKYPVNRVIKQFPYIVFEARGYPYPKYKYWKLENDTLVRFSSPVYKPDSFKALLRLNKDYNCYTDGAAILVKDKKGTIVHTFKLPDFPGYSTKFNQTLLDRQGILWMSTENGLFKMTVRKNPFKTSHAGNSIRGIFKEDRKLWTGGYFGNTVENIYDTTVKKQLPGSMLMSFYKDRDGLLWIGKLRGEVMAYDPKQDTYTRYSLGKGSFRLPFQNAVTGTYWIGTDNGIVKFDKENENITPFALPVPSQALRIRQWYQNPEGIWIASSNGLFLMDAKKETIVKHYTKADGFPATDINHIHEDDKGVFWMGTLGSGLIRWDRANNSFRQYTRNNGLSNNTIYAVYEDNFETLWLPSNYGLMNFDKTTATTEVYLPRNGIPHEEFNTYAHFQDNDGTLYFGGLNGVIRFHPATLRKEHTASPPLYAIKVSILEEGAETLTDKTSIYNTTKAISLNPGDRILEVTLTLLDYENSTENQYAYKLDGLQEQWIYIADNKISIINPPYGRYDLVIKARGASGQWSEKQLSIPLYIKTPFYLQWWFIITVILLIAAGVFAAVRWRIRKLQKDRERLEGEVRKRTQKIAEQAEALQALDKAKTRFFANITHEFRTPLTLVTGPVRQIMEKPPSPGMLQRTLSGVLRNAEQLLGLINQLLDISKLESNKMKIEISHGDIISYTRELARQFQTLADKKSLHLNIVMPSGAWETHFDKDKWDKILYNLLSNAIKFTPEGGRITVQMKKLEQDDQKHIQLCVKDTGTGIAAEKLPHIFDRFYQIDDSITRKGEGTGIGLALVKELVELQKGTIAVESTPEQGAAFTVRLPIARETTVAASVMRTVETRVPVQMPVETIAETAPVTHAQEKSHREQLELLIVEDNNEMRAYIRSCIDETIYAVTEAENGEEGIAKALKTVPDLIISDVMMPKKDGFELTQAIRNHVATSHIPLILLTAKASLESRLKGLERGADAYLTKPFSPEELALRIKKLIELRKRLQQRYQGSELPEDTAEFRREDSFVAELNTYINDHIAEPNLNVEAISAHFSISRAQFYRKLKALLNKPIAHYIRSVRLETAISLLKEQQLNITEVAYATGFSSLSHFSKTFKRVYGKPPSEWL